MNTLQGHFVISGHTWAYGSLTGTKHTQAVLLQGTVLLKVAWDLPLALPWSTPAL